MAGPCAMVGRQRHRVRTCALDNSSHGEKINHKSCVHKSCICTTHVCAFHRAAMVTVVEDAAGAAATPAAPTGALEDAMVIDDDYSRPLQGGSLREVGAPRSLLPLQGTCQACLASGAAAMEASRLDYGGGVQLLVDVVGSEEEARKDAEDQGGRQGVLVCVVGLRQRSTAVCTGTRTSKRARGNRKAIEVSSAEVTLDGLRLLVYEQCGVHPKNAALYQGGRLIEGEGDVTLRGACGVWGADASCEHRGEGVEGRADQGGQHARGGR